MMKHKLFTLCMLLGACCLQMRALTVDDLRVENRVNPVGIDPTVPHFSWKLQSQEHSVLQTAYNISVSTDQAGQDVIWTSGNVDSDASQYVSGTGIQLTPRTRYYWTVSVTDNHGNTATSTQQAYFETGLMDAGWNGAQWICATDNAYTGQESAESSDDAYTITARITISHAAAGLIFAGQDTNNFYMWQFNVEGSAPRLRPHVWSNGTGSCIDNVTLTGEAKIKLNTAFNVRIEVSDGGSKATTYINDVKVDERTGNFTRGLMGFRQATAESDSQLEAAYFDNIQVTSSTGEILFSEDFSNGNSTFNGGTVKSGRLYVSTTTIVWQKGNASSSSSASHYIYEADMTLVKDNMGLVFGYVDNTHYHMWQINTSEKSTAFIRRHLYTGSTSPSTSEVTISSVTRSNMLGHTHHISIEVNGSLVTTSIDGTKVDSYTDATGALSGAVGMRAYGASGGDQDEAYFDNVRLTTYDQDGKETVTMDENFEGAWVENFPSADVTTYQDSEQMHLQATSGEKMILSGSAGSGASMFRREIALHGGILRAQWYTSAIGIYDLFINGQRVGHVQQDGSVRYDELKPGWTDYSDHVFYSTHDVTSYLQEGTNALAAVVSDGWASGGVAWNAYGNPAPAFLGDLVVTYQDMTTETYVTDQQWASSKNGPIRVAEIYDGETYNAMLEDNWNKPNYDQSKWHAVRRSTFSNGQIQAYIGEPVTTRQDLILPVQTATFYSGTKSTGTTYGMIDATQVLTSPTSFTLHKGEKVVLDFGQNFAGWMQFTARAKQGTNMTMRFGEMLNDDGSASRGNDGPGGSVYLANLRTALATNIYIFAGLESGETYHPTHTFFGFRYCVIQASNDVEFTSVEGQPVTSSLEDTGTFQSSHSAVNQLASNIMWGQRSNYLSIPTDCPQRNERQGWTADTQIYASAGIYNADMNLFFHKWMQDMRDGQTSAGAYPDIAPTTPMVGSGNGAWGDAGIVVPWVVYMQYGDRSILEENWESMEKYMSWLDTQASGGYKFQGAGLAYGDWLSFVSTDTRYVCVAYHGYDILLMSKMAAALSQQEGDYYDTRATYYKNQLVKFRTEFRNRYFSSGPAISTQTALLMALQFDLLSRATDINTCKNRLKSLITTNKETLNTGFVGTGILNQTLSRFDLSDKAYNLLLQRNCPSWLYSVDQGATTMWERWNSYTKATGFGDVGMNSFNHYAYGAVGEWMYRYVLGISSDEAQPGFKHIILQPTPDTRTKLPTGQEKITYARGSYNSFYGEIQSAWTMGEDGNIAYTCTVPANTTATLYLPVSEENLQILNDGKPIEECEGIQQTAYESGKATLELGSGSYSFTIGDIKDKVENIQQDANCRVTPNPATTQISIQCTQPITGLQIHTMNGAQVLSQDHVDGPVNVSMLPAATYVVTVTTTDKTYTSKLIKK